MALRTTEEGGTGKSPPPLLSLCHWIPSDNQKSSINEMQGLDLPLQVLDIPFSRGERVIECMAAPESYPIKQCLLNVALDSFLIKKSIIE